MLFNGMLHLMLWEGWTDSAYIERHTMGFDALKNLVRDATPDRVARDCGLAVDVDDGTGRTITVAGPPVALAVALNCMPRSWASV